MERGFEGWFLEDMHGKGALRKPKEGKPLHIPKHPFTAEKARRFRQLRETADLEVVTLLTSIIPLRDSPLKMEQHYDEVVALHEPQHEEDYFLNYEPVDGAKEALHAINRLGWRVTIATGTPECCGPIFQKMVIDDGLDDALDEETPMMMTRVPPRIAHGLWPGIVTTTDTKLLDGLHLELAYGVKPDLGDDSPYVAMLYDKMLGGRVFLYLDEEEQGRTPALLLPESEDYTNLDDYSVKGGIIIPVEKGGISGAAQMLEQIQRESRARWLL